ncbi:MAG: UDP-N-acetylmuramoyl-L-alanine--D-glutamate ligase [Nitratireductor sp.]|nr:UDP-N-acetylmuramoyl-L-alanine--D-glutamate ligase [Nitratireductor sp.]
MIAATTAKGKRIALFGLGGSGLATAHALSQGGADLVCFDDNPEKVKQAQAEGLTVRDLREVDFSSVDELVLSPGVPLTHPRPHWSVELARKAGKPVVGDIELFVRERNARAPECPLIAVTGTNGKSTTTALIAHVLKSAGRDTQMGGNIGTAALLLDPPASDRFYVIECSSYQIDLAPSLNPSAGILLNLTPDHLDRHGSMDNYAAIKERLVAASGTAIVGVDDSYCTAIASYLEAQGRKVLRISSSANLHEGIHFRDGWIVKSGAGGTQKLFDLNEAPALRGKHNAQNAAATWAVLAVSGLSSEEIAEGMRSFPGLAHRMEQVGRIGKTLFVNDSKATNADAAAMALGSFENIHWIAGGLAKEGGIESLGPFFSRIRRAYLIGEAAPAFAATLGGKLPFEISGTLDAAVVHAAGNAAQEGEETVVLLSPACASFDQFPNFEKRGDAFREAVLALEGIKPMKEVVT